MKKVMLLLLALLFLLPAVAAINVTISSSPQNIVLVKELNQPVSFNLSVTNNGPSDNFHFYNLVGFFMKPEGSFYLVSGQTKNVTVTIDPVAPLNYEGYYQFNYFIQNDAGNRSSESLVLLVTNLQNSFSVGASEINPESNSITIYIKNKVNYDFNNLSVVFSSPFFTLDKHVSLSQNGQEDFNVTLNKDDFKSLLAGFYTLSANVNADGKTATVEGNIKFQSKNIVNTTEQNLGFIIFTKTIKKTNNGNVVSDVQTVVEKGIISRLFTTFSPDPDSVTRNGTKIYYTWNNKIQPGDTLTISVKTNWLFPLFIIIFLVVVIVLVKQFSKTDLVMDKKVSFLHAKGGEFALKVTVAVTAKKFVERLTITDKLPPLVKLYEKFGTEKPSRVDEKGKRVEWYFDHLEPGEVRILNYVVYSKVGVLGRFALPTATAIYERNGKILETESNRAFLVAEQSVIKEKD